MSQVEIENMGNSDSKLVFKQGIFKLSEPESIPADDPYWRGVSLPEPFIPSILLIDISSGSFLSPQKMSSASSPRLMFAGRGTAPSQTSNPLF